MLTIYRLLTRLIYTVAYPVGKAKASKGNQKWIDRLGVADGQESADIWLHAASVGEVKVLGNLYNHIRKRRSTTRFCVSVLTDAGYKTAEKIFKNNSHVRYLPADSTPAVNRVLDSVRPQCLVIAETEIWPNLVTLAGRREIPIILINGRMTDKGLSRYRWFGSLLRRVLSEYDRFFFKSETDAGRFRFFGVPAERYQIVGDMKFDAPLWPRSEGRREEMRFRVGADPEDFVLVAGSTRPGEEALLVGALKRLKSTSARTRLVLAPRHVERREEIEFICAEAGIKYVIYGNDASEADVIIVDRMGLLMDLYMAGEIAFVGGTLVDVGGHNLLEPVWTGTPVLFGPSLDNVWDAADYVTAHDFGMRITDIDELVQVVGAFREGQKTFAKKTEHDLDESATAIAGDYILSKLHGA